MAIEYDYFQNAVLVNFVEYNNTKKDKHGVSAVKLHSIFAFYFLKLLTGVSCTPGRLHRRCNLKKKKTLNGIVVLYLSVLCFLYSTKFIKLLSEKRYILLLYPVLRHLLYTCVLTYSFNNSEYQNESFSYLFQVLIYLPHMCHLVMWFYSCHLQW